MLRKKLSGNGYKGHHPGSRKERVHREFDKRGKARAIRLAKKLGLSEPTIKTWVWCFGRDFAEHYSR